MRFQHNVFIFRAASIIWYSAICSDKLFTKLQKLDLCKYIAAASARSFLCIHVLAIILYLLLRETTLKYLPLDMKCQH